ncbi:MAG: UDP-N-acetylmuramate--L-alanine ligase [Candidatus Buchananbacteria bacterium]
MVDLNKINYVHFIGIGGIGISAAAGILKRRSFVVSGSDTQESEMTANLRQSGILVYVPHNADIINNEIGLIVYSVAVPEDNPERASARELNIPEMTYPQLLGEIMKGKIGIGITGTDGKTTTTAMLAKIMIDADLDPSVVLGSQAEFLDDNCRLGKSKYFVFEGDEYRRAFDNYEPQIAVITNVGVDHLDYYKSGMEYLGAFEKYLNKLPADGFAIINNDDARSVEAGSNCPARKVTYGINNSADYAVKNIRVIDGRQEFSVLENGEAAATITLGLPGHYNVSNALAAIAAARQLDVGWDAIVKSLDSFKGTWRRFEKLGKLGNAEVIADYAHTPPAIKQVIAAMKEFYPDKKILYVFQPHQYARTKNLFSEFVSAFSEAEKAVIVDIFYVAGRERPEDYDVSSQILANAISEGGVDAVYGGSLKETEYAVRDLADQYDVIMVLGAGDIYGLAKNLVK